MKELERRMKNEAGILQDTVRGLATARDDDAYDRFCSNCGVPQNCDEIDEAICGDGTPNHNFVTYDQLSDSLQAIADEWNGEEEDQ